MHRVVITLLGVLLLGGCATPTVEREFPDDPGVFVPRSIPAAPPPAPRPSTEAEVPKVRLDPRVHGRIASVNVALRFVVMEFPVWRLPAPGQRLNVYRGEQKIGEVKVTGPTIDTTVAGDLLIGEAQPGDEVRQD
jgi:hypothetical protein